MPTPKEGESQKDFVNRCVPIAMKAGKEQKQAVAICYSMFREHQKKQKEMNVKFSLLGLKTKEEGEDILISGLAATTYPDRENEILSKNVMDEIVGYINMVDSSGGNEGSYRSVSLYHDWIKEGDPTLDEAAFTIPGSAKVIELKDGHYGVEVITKLNKYYKGDLTPEEIKYRIDNGSIAGFSIEYDYDKDKIQTINYDGEDYKFIDGLTEFGGLGFARARMIANPTAVIYKEIELKANVNKTNASGFIKAHGKSKKNTKEVMNMAEEENKAEVKEPEEKTEAKEEIKEEIVEKKVEEKVEEKKTEEIKEKKDVDIKKVLSSKEFKEAVGKELKVKKKVLKETKEEQKMGSELLVKEMNESLAKGSEGVLQFKELASNYFAEHPEIDDQLRTVGIPLHTTLKVKCVGTKLRIVGKLQTKDVLDTSTNTATDYTQSIVEFADIYLPGIIDTYNNQTNYFGELRKVEHIRGGNYYGWRITASQQTTLSVDPDETSIAKKAVKKYKLRTDIKEYRLGVSVSDYTLFHSRAAIGDLFAIEVEKTMRDVMKDINKDLFTEQADGDGTKILGLEAVADSAGNTSLYGLTRSTTNRLAPASATDTYTAVGGALTTAYIRQAVRAIEKEGALRGNLRIIVDPKQRDVLYELMDDNQRFAGMSAVFGFKGGPSYDGIPMIVDSDCQDDGLFVIDMESDYIVMSRPPQLIGLAKVGAADEAYISVYLAHVYEQPRRCYMLDTLT